MKISLLNGARHAFLSRNSSRPLFFQHHPEAYGRNFSQPPIESTVQKGEVLAIEATAATPAAATPAAVTRKRKKDAARARKAAAVTAAGVTTTAAGAITTAAGAITAAAAAMAAAAPKKSLFSYSESARKAWEETWHNHFILLIGGIVVSGFTTAMFVLSDNDKTLEVDHLRSDLNRLSEEFSAIREEIKLAGTDDELPRDCVDRLFGISDNIIMRMRGVLSQLSAFQLNLDGSVRNDALASFRALHPFRHNLAMNMCNLRMKAIEVGHACLLSSEPNANIQSIVSKFTTRKADWDNLQKIYTEALLSIKHLDISSVEVAARNSLTDRLFVSAYNTTSNTSAEDSNTSVEGTVGAKQSPF